MDTQRKYAITNAEIDAMTDEELLRLAKTQGKYVGQRFTTVTEDHFHDRVLDAPHFLRRLCQVHPKQFSKLLAEIFFTDAAHWNAVGLSQGRSVHNLSKIEASMPQKLSEVQENTMRGSGGPWKMTVERSFSLDSALLLEVSDVAWKLWQEQYPKYHFQKTKSHQLAEALVMRERWLNKTQAESVQVFYQLGWKPLDVMLAWIMGTVSTETPIDPDCAAAAAREDPETAVWLLDPDHYRALFTDQYHPSYDVAMAQTWTTFLYCNRGWTDFTPLEKGHRLKKMNAHYKEVLERCHTPDWARLVFEKELRKVGLLSGETTLDWSSPKLAKAQRLALTKALVFHYQWRAADLLKAFVHSGNKKLFMGLLWGIYYDDRLETAFLLDSDGTAREENGEALDIPSDGQVGLVSTTELTKQQLALWKKRIKEAGVKQPIRQLAIPAQPPFFDDIGGRNTKHITIYTVSGKWGLEMGDYSGHCRADLLDPIHHYGARIVFDHVSNGPEYNEEDVMLHGVAFYRLGDMPFEDYLPQRAVISPEELPARFVSMAGAAFKQMAGLK